MAERVRPTVETYVLASCIRAILALQGALANAGDLTRRALENVVRTSNYDGFVAAYRAYPELLTTASHVASSHTLADVVRRAKDFELAGQVADFPAVVRDDQPSLSRRETEVLDLVSQGLRNREIAQLLFISESTVKVHVRHIFEKLGVRSRAEAASLFASRAEKLTLRQQLP